MTHHNLYLQSNRHFAARAALISVAKSDRRTEDTFLIYLLNISTLVHFAEGALGFIAMHVAKRVLSTRRLT